MNLKQLQSLVVLSLVFHQVTESNGYFITTPGLHTTSGDGQVLSLQWEFGGGGFISEVFMLHNDTCVIHFIFGHKFICSGNPLDTSVRDIEITGRSLNHIIHSVHRKDAGYYTCVISNGTAANYTDSNAVIYVFDKPDKAKVTPSGSDHEGNTFALRCHAASTSLPVANRSQVNMVHTWRNNSEDLDPGDLPERYSITSSGNPANAVNDLLVITDLSRHDAGSYTCYGQENSSTLLSETSNSYMLIPQFAPYNVQASMSGEIIEYGRLGPVQCSAVCNPPCSYSWHKGGANLSSNAELMIRNVTRDDHGVYECRPDNGIPGGQTADFDLTVFYGPSIVSFEGVSHTGPINQGDDVTFVCETDSRPMPFITLIRPSGDTLVSSSTSNTLKHTLTDIDCLDSGVYRCVANNSRTEQINHKMVQVEVQCPPRKHSTSDVKVGATEGDTASFSITAIASPQPNFTWFFNGTVLLDQNYVIMSYSLGFVPEVYFNSTLTLSNLSQFDFGNYSVSARNPLGAMEDVIYSLIPADDGVSPVGIISGVMVAVVVLFVVAVIGFVIWRRKSQADVRKSNTNISELGHVNPVMVTDDDISLTANGKHDSMSGSTAPELAEYADVGVVKKKHAQKPMKSDAARPGVVEYGEVYSKKSPGVPAVAAAAAATVAAAGAALPEYSQVDFSKKSKQGNTTVQPQLEEYALVDFSMKNKKGKNPKPGAAPPCPPRAASIDEQEVDQSPSDHTPQYSAQGTLYADLDLINTSLTCAEPTVHANLELSVYASIEVP